MTDPTCVRCGFTGVVGRERTIKGDMVTIEYTCGRCQNQGPRGQGDMGER